MLRPLISSNLGERTVKNTAYFEQYKNRLKKKYQEEGYIDQTDKLDTAISIYELLMKSMYNVSVVSTELEAFTHDFHLELAPDIKDPVINTQWITTSGKM